MELDRKDIGKVVKILLDDGALVLHAAEFADHLQVPDNESGEWIRQMRSESLPPYDLFKNLLDHWMSRNGSGATIEALVEILRTGLHHNYSADKLEKEFLQQTSSDKHLDQLIGEKAIGSGTFGLVFKVKDRSTGIVSALKIIVPFQESSLEQTKREYDAMSKINHKNVVKSIFSAILANGSGLLRRIKANFEVTSDIAFLREYEAAVHRTNWFPTVCIQMELCGPDLRQWLNDDAISLERIRMKPNFKFETGKKQIDIANGILNGLKFLHYENIIHRDLKPENIYFSLGARGEFKLPIKIGDFGLARDLPDGRSQTLTKQRGTILYRAREVDQGHYGKKADLYAFGLILWELFQVIKYLDIRKYFEDFRSDDRKIQPNCDYIENFKSLVKELTDHDKDKRPLTTAVELIFSEEFIRLNDPPINSKKSSPWLC